MSFTIIGANVTLRTIFNYVMGLMEMTLKRRNRDEAFQMASEALGKIRPSDLARLLAGSVEERLHTIRALGSLLSPVDNVHVHLVAPAVFLQEHFADRTPAMADAPEPCGKYRVQDSSDNPLTQVKISGRPLYVDCKMAGVPAEKGVPGRGGHRVAAYFVPLVVQKGVIGVMQAETADSVGIPKAVRMVFDWLAVPFAMAIENAWLSQAINKQTAKMRKGPNPGGLDDASLAPEYGGARLAHDIKNALTTISTFLQLLPAKWDDTHFRTTFYPVTREATHQANHLIDDFLDQGKTSRMSRATVDIRELVARLVASKAPLAEQRNVQLKTHFSLKSGVTRLDEDTIREALTNLINNALEATPDAGVITIRLEDMVLPGGRPAIKMEIEDSGPGIDKEMQATLFEPYTSSKTGDQLAGGTGLGLYIAQRHIQAHGGMIEVESPGALGALFRVVLPVERRWA